MNLEERIKALEDRVAQLEFDALPNKRLGPRPEDLKPDPKVVDELVETAKKAIARGEAERNRRGLEVLKQKSEEHGAAVCTTDGKPPDPDYVALGSAPKSPKPGSAMHESYYVLCENERAKGFVRPLRTSYRHVGIRPQYPIVDLTPEQHKQYDKYGYVKWEKWPEEKGLGRYWTKEQLESGCNTVTTMGLALAETYARDPEFYGATFCCHCQKHLPLEEFVWEGTNEKVGS